MPMTKKTEEFINSEVAFVTSETPIQDAVKLMVDRKISSVLVIDTAEKVVGILTEKDIVQKFTLLDVKDKLTKQVNTVMSPGVVFVKLDRLLEDATQLYMQKGFKHFPVVKGHENKKSDIVGLISISDLFRYFASTYKDLLSSTTAADPEKVLSCVGVLAKGDENTQSYISIFSKLGFNVVEVQSFDKFAEEHGKPSDAVIFDMDGFSEKELHDLIVKTKKFAGQLVMTTSNLGLIPLFQKFLDKKRQTIAVKPINISYLYWLLKHSMPKL